MRDEQTLSRPLPLKGWPIISVLFRIIANPGIRCSPVLRGLPNGARDVFSFKNMTTPLTYSSNEYITERTDETHHTDRPAWV
jgi:hypothetical protein